MLGLLPAPSLPQEAVKLAPLLEDESSLSCGSELGDSFPGSEAWMMAAILTLFALLAPLGSGWFRGRVEAVEGDLVCDAGGGTDEGLGEAAAETTVVAAGALHKVCLPLLPADFLLVGLDDIETKVLGTVVLGTGGLLVVHVVVVVVEGVVGTGPTLFVKVVFVSLLSGLLLVKL